MVASRAGRLIVNSYLATTALWWIWAGIREGRKIAVAFRLNGAQTRPQEGEITGELPKVSVVIPARNEAVNIGACTDSVLAQDYPQLECIVVDDDSADDTKRIVAEMAGRDRRLKVIPAGPLPPGWTGKNHAVWQGYRQATGEWLLFLDADTRLAPSCLRRAVEYARRHRLDLLSLAAYQEAYSFAERLVQPWVYAALDFRLPSWAAAADPGGALALANGQFILAQRPAYERLGTHAAVAGEVIEDVALARAARAAGARTAFVPAPALVRARMYSTWSEIRAGWGKNLAQVVGGGPGGALWVAVFLLMASVGPFLALAASLIHRASVRRDGNWVTIGLSMAASGLACLTDGVLRYQKNVWPGYSLLHPLGALALVYLLLLSSWRRIRRQPAIWKGRSVP